MHVQRLPGVVWFGLFRLEGLYNDIWYREISVEVGRGEGLV